MSLMKQRKKPDALFCVNDETAIGALAALHQLGIRVPEDVGVVGFSNFIAGQYTFPSLTSVDQFGTLIGTKATTALLALLQSNPDVETVESASPYKQVITEPQLVCRASSNRLGH
jgi:LacI family transcriptional regulator